MNDTDARTQSVKAFQGIGKLSKGGQPLGQALYQVRVLRPNAATESATEQMEITIIPRSVHMFSLLGDRLTLHLEGGGQLDVTYDGRRYVALSDIGHGPDGVEPAN